MLLPLAALALSAPALAGGPCSINPILLDAGTDMAATDMVVTTPVGDPTTTVLVDVSSAIGRETVSLVESDAWLHGGAALTTLPSVDATVTLTLYDSRSAVLTSYTGALGVDASFSLAGDPTSPVDVDVLATELFAAPTGGYDMTLDLAGADIADVAYGELTITQVIPPCVGRGCEPDPRTLVTTAEIDWDDVGVVWEGALTLPHAGLLAARARTYDATRALLSTTRVTLGVPWRDGGYGTTALVTTQDPLTSVAILSDQVHAGGTEAFARIATSSCGTTGGGRFLSVVSGGWSTTAAIPAAAQVVLDGGETLTIPVNSYQRPPSRPGMLVDALPGDLVAITVNGGNLTLDDASVFDIAALAAPVCYDGTCVAIAETAGSYELSVTGYSETPGTLPTAAVVEVTVYDVDGAERGAETFRATFDDRVAVVFASTVCVVSDPIGLDLTGQVTLLTAPDARGTQKSLGRGFINGTFGRDADGDLGLSGIDRATAVPRGDILIGGEPIGFERTTDENGDGVLNAPPVILLMTTGNGKGTRAVATSSTGSPGLL